MGVIVHDEFMNYTHKVDVKEYNKKSAWCFLPKKKYDISYHKKHDAL